MGYPNGLYIDATKGTPTDHNIPATLLVQNTIIAGCSYARFIWRQLNSSHRCYYCIHYAWFNTAAYGNSILTNNTDVGLTAPFQLYRT